MTRIQHEHKDKDTNKMVIACLSPEAQEHAENCAIAKDGFTRQRLKHPVECTDSRKELQVQDAGKGVKLEFWPSGTTSCLGRENAEDPSQWV